MANGKWQMVNEKIVCWLLSTDYFLLSLITIYIIKRIWYNYLT